MDLRKVKKLIELLEDSQLNELEITEGDNCIRLSRGQTAPSMGQMPYPAPAPMPLAPAQTSANASEPMEQSAVVPASNATIITSPMVGTFYASPNPDDAAFVSVGQKIKEGDTICIIEAMKTFNQVESELPGEIVEIHKKSGDPVEYGEPLFSIAV